MGISGATGTVLRSSGIALNLAFRVTLGVLLFMVLCASNTTIVAAQDSQKDIKALRQTQGELEKARNEKRSLADKRESLAKELQNLRQKLIHAAQDTQEREAIITNLEGQLDQLAAEKKRRGDALQERAQQLSGALSALTRLSRNPPHSILFQPGGPLTAVRGSLLLQSSIPTLRDRADLLKEELTALEIVEADILDKLTELGDAERDLAGDRKNLESLIQQKNTLLASTNAAVETAEDRVTELSRKVAGLEELLKRLAEGRTAQDGVALKSSSPSVQAPKRDTEAEQPVEETIASLTGPPVGLRPFPKNGKINRPVTGAVTRRYGQDTGFGQTSKGIVIETRAKAQITAPFDGKVAFAGQFQKLGLILIIEHSDDYHSVLAGLSRIDAVSGQWVLAGEPVGIMGEGDESSKSKRPELYVELRRGGQPVNPLQWISARDSDQPPSQTGLKSKT